MSLINLEISIMIYMKGKGKLVLLVQFFSCLRTYDSELHVVVVNVVDLVS